MAAGSMRMGLRSAARSVGGVGRDVNRVGSATKRSGARMTPKQVQRSGYRRMAGVGAGGVMLANSGSSGSSGMTPHSSGGATL